jgi:hypothetical protein
LFFEEELINKTDNIWRKRSTSTSDQTGTILDREAEGAIATAERVLRMVEEKTRPTV